MSAERMFCCAAAGMANAIAPNRHAVASPVRAACQNRLAFNLFTDDSSDQLL